jgi:hypothetical protein
MFERERGLNITQHNSRSRDDLKLASMSDCQVSSENSVTPTTKNNTIQSGRNRIRTRVVGLEIRHDIQLHHTPGKPPPVPLLHEYCG